MANFNKIDWNNWSIKGMPQTFQRLNPIPLDESAIHYSMNDLEDYAANSPKAYAGQYVALVDIDNQEVTPYIINVDRTLSLLGGGFEPLSATNYTEALTLATAENLTRVILTTTDEIISGVNYTAGLYVVNGINSLAKLGTTSASGDIAGDVQSIKGDVSTLKDNVKALQAKDKDLSESITNLETKLKKEYNSSIYWYGEEILGDTNNN